MSQVSSGIIEIHVPAPRHSRRNTMQFMLTQTADTRHFRHLFIMSLLLPLPPSPPTLHPVFWCPATPANTIPHHSEVILKSASEVGVRSTPTPLPLHPIHWCSDTIPKSVSETSVRLTPACLQYHPCTCNTIAKVIERSQ